MRPSPPPSSTPVTASAWRRRLLRLAGGLAFALVLWVNLEVIASQLVFLSPPAAGAPASLTVSEPRPGDRRVLHNRQLYDQGIYTMYLEGPSYARGHAAGLLAADLDIALETELFDTFHQAVPNPFARYLILRGVALGAAGIQRHMLPEALDELRGFSDAVPDRWSHLAPAFTRKVHYHAIHDIGQALVDSPLIEMACTGFMAGGPSTSDGNWLLARNFDFDGGRLFDSQKAIVFTVPEQGIPYASVSFAGFAGAMSGMNAHGLALALQAGGSSTPVRLGMPMTLIAREILQYASSLDEAEAILQARKGFVAENVLIVDGAAGQAALFEVSPERVERIDVSGDLSVSNHFRSPAFAKDPVNLARMAEGTTVPRLQRMEELVEQRRGSLDMDSAIDILKDRSALGGEPLPRGHRQAIDADLATHSVVMDATARVIRVSRSPNLSGGFVEIRLDDGLAGRLEVREVLPPGDVDATLAVHQARRLVRKASREGGTMGAQLAREALDLAPGHIDAMILLARAEAREGRFEQAQALASEALATPPETPRQARDLREILAGSGGAQP